MTILIVFLKLKDLSGSQIVNSYPSKSSRCYLKGLSDMVFLTDLILNEFMNRAQFKFTYRA